MKKKVVLELALVVFIASSLILSFDSRPIAASGTIYIRADGSVAPPTAPISTTDNVTYTFTDNIYEPIVVERNNIVVDGADYTVQRTLVGYRKGIDLSGRSNVTIRNTKVNAFDWGIYLYGSLNNTVAGNNVTNNEYGILLGQYSNYNTVLGNSMENNSACGIYTDWASDNSFFGNNITDNERGILLDSSSDNVLRNNTMTSNHYNFGAETKYTHDIDDSNTVDGKPLYYLVNQEDLVINPSTYPNVGYLALVGSNNITIEGLELKNNMQGILLAQTRNSQITNNTITDNYRGIHMYYSLNNSIHGNTIANNSDYGVVLHYVSDYNVFSENNITNNYGGGISLSFSDGNSLSGNNITNNTGLFGIELDYSSDNVLRDNTMADNHYNFHVYFNSVSGCINDIDDSNTVDGKPVYYWIGRQNEEVPHGAGYVALVNSNNITVTGLELKHNGQGTLLANTTNSQITNNNITNSVYGIEFFESTNNTVYGNWVTKNIEELNTYGIYLRESSNYNTISGNNITMNSHVAGFNIIDSFNNTISGNNITNSIWGICLQYSGGNIIFGNNITNNSEGVCLFSSSNNNRVVHNNFINNTQQVLVWNVEGNVLDDGYPSGGNYWSDYTGVDSYSGPYQNETGGDGIGDASYVINVNNTDRYPLINPWPDVTPPMIIILSPQNTTYQTSSVPLTFTVNEAVSWMGYSLDNQANVTIAGNTTLTGLALEPHNVIVYANDTYGNMGFSDSVYFTNAVNDVAVLNVSASPTETYVNQIVNINVTVDNRGTVSETFNVTAYYDSNPADTQTVVNLAPSSNITITFGWNTSGVQKGTYTMSAEAEVVPGETNITDNTYVDDTVTILNSPPTIDSFAPVNTTPEVNEGESLEFTHTSSDPDDDALTYSWVLDSVEQSTGQNWTYSPSYDDAGTHNVTLVVSDGEVADSQEWTVTTINVNRAPTVDSLFPLTNPTISEGEFQEFNVTYSDPDLDPLTVQWYLNGTQTVTADSYIFTADFASAGSYNVTVVVSDGSAEASHEWILTIIDVNRPPAIDSFFPSNDPTISEGESQEFNITYHDPDGDLVLVQWYLNSSPTATTDSYAFVAENGSAGTYNITVTVTDASSEAKHEWILTVEWVGIHDVAVVEVTLSKTIVGQNFVVDINVTVGNLGNFTENVEITAYANNMPIQVLNIPNLPFGTTTTLTFTWNTTDWAKGNYTITAYATPVPDETYTTDNTCVGGWIFLVVPGDVNADGYVGIDDIFAIASHFGEDPSNPSWNANYDINGDDYIGIDDIFIAASHFGEENP